MPLYYFDVFDGDQIMRDEIGIDCPDEDEAAKQAMAALSDIVQEGLPGGPQGEFWVKVREESGAYIFAADLKFTADWLRSR